MRNFHGEPMYYVSIQHSHHYDEKMLNWSKLNETQTRCVIYSSEAKFDVQIQWLNSVYKRKKKPFTPKFWKTIIMDWVLGGNNNRKVDRAD